MSGHHRGTCQSICHSRCQLVDSITSGRIPNNVDGIRIHLFQNHQILNQSVEELVDVPLMPKIPSICRGSRSYIDHILRFVSISQANLVFPLGIIHSRRSSATPMHGDKEAPTLLWFLSIFFTLKTQGMVSDANHFLLYFSRPLFPDGLLVFFP